MLSSERVPSIKKGSQGPPLCTRATTTVPIQTRAFARVSHGCHSLMQELVQSILKRGSWQKHHIVYTKNQEQLLVGFLNHRCTSELNK